MTSMFLLLATIVILGGAGALIFLIENPDIINQELTQSSCEEANGNWNACGSKCMLINIDPGIACAQVCEELCQCGGIAGLSCPAGYSCKLPEGIADAIGYCEKK